MQSRFFQYVYYKGKQARLPTTSVLIFVTVHFLFFTVINVKRQGKQESSFHAEGSPALTFFGKSRRAHNSNSSSLLQGRFRTDVLEEIRTLGKAAIRDLPGDKKLGFVGIFCSAGDSHVRSLIRQTTMQVADALGHRAITAMFIICRRPVIDLDLVFWSELRQHQDIHLIDCVENMDEGKTFQYFANIKSSFPDFQYYCKMDTDSYVLFHNLAFALSQAPRFRFYGGRRSGPDYMSGSLYIVSSDLVELMVTCQTLALQPCDDTTGFEDAMMGRLIKEMTIWAGEHYSAPRNHAIADHNYAELLEWGPSHSVLLDRDPWPGLDGLHPFNILIHDVKNISDWWQIQKHYVDALTAMDIEGAKNELFFS